MSFRTRVHFTSPGCVLPNCPGWNLQYNIPYKESTDIFVFFLILRGKLSFIRNYDVSCKFFHRWSLSGWGSPHLLLVFLSWKGVKLSKTFFASIEMIIYGVVSCPLSYLINMVYCLHGFFHVLHQLCIPGIKLTWSWCRNKLGEKRLSINILYNSFTNQIVSKIYSKKNKIYSNVLLNWLRYLLNKNRNKEA